MDLIVDGFFDSLKKKRRIYLLVYALLTLAFTFAYVFSFRFNVLYAPLLIGASGVITLVLFYYGLIFDKSKLIKLNKNMSVGIRQNDTYRFSSLDGDTEHDGIRLVRLLCTFEDEGEAFERTLYFLKDLPYPTLSEGQEIRVETYQNIILRIDVI